MRGPRLKLLLAAGGLVALAGLLLLLLTAPSGDHRALLAEARNRVLNSTGWRFVEGVNCSDSFALVTGNVSLKEHRLWTSVTVLPKTGAPQAYFFYANKTASFVSLEGAWVRSGGGWRVEETVLVRLLELASQAQEVYVSRGNAGVRLLFNGTCSSECISLFNSIATLAGSRVESPAQVSGSVVLSGGAPRRVFLVFRGASGFCAVNYTVFDFNSEIEVRGP